MEWAGRPNHIRGVPRKMVFMVAGGFAKLFASFLNSTSVQNAQTLIRLVRSRPPGVPLITVSNHMSTLDDPLMWGFKGFPSINADLARWVLTAEDICFNNSFYSYMFRLGTCATSCGQSRVLCFVTLISSKCLFFIFLFSVLFFFFLFPFQPGIFVDLYVTL